MKIPWKKILKEIQESKLSKARFLCFRSKTFNALWNTKEGKKKLICFAHKFLTQKKLPIGLLNTIESFDDPIFFSVSFELRIRFLCHYARVNPESLSIDYLDHDGRFLMIQEEDKEP
jgi:hypothetical protein